MALRTGHPVLRVQSQHLNELVYQGQRISSEHSERVAWGIQKIAPDQIDLEVLRVLS